MKIIDLLGKGVLNSELEWKLGNVIDEVIWLARHFNVRQERGAVEMTIKFICRDLGIDYENCEHVDWIKELTTINQKAV